MSFDEIAGFPQLLRPHRRFGGDAAFCICCKIPETTEYNDSFRR